AFAGDGEVGDFRADAGVHAQAVPLGADAQEVLGDGYEVPGGGAGEPRVLGFAVAHGVFAGDHLRVHVGLGAVDLADVFDVGGRDLLIVLERALAAADHGLRDHHPRVIVAEDARVLLVTRRV